MSAATLERALQLLLHARNSHGLLRGEIRRLIHADIRSLRALRAGGAK